MPSFRASCIAMFMRWIYSVFGTSGVVSTKSMYMRARMVFFVAVSPSPGEVINWTGMILFS